MSWAYVFSRDSGKWQRSRKLTNSLGKMYIKMDSSVYWRLGREIQPSMTMKMWWQVASQDISCAPYKLCSNGVVHGVANMMQPSFSETAASSRPGPDHRGRLQSSAIDPPVGMPWSNREDGAMEGAGQRASKSAIMRLVFTLDTTPRGTWTARDEVRKETERSREWEVDYSGPQFTNFVLCVILVTNQIGW